MIKTHNLPITAVNKRREAAFKWSVSIIVDEGDVQASTRFHVYDEDDIPYRGDHVDVKQDVETGEAWIVWLDGWF